ncbi:hypothetical protein AC628_18550 [Bradyrhizobium sp. NAS96.2]|nr:hypothetical protein AC628_18550 [Bradyrhizobium sp. NAS96.2]
MKPMRSLTIVAALAIMLGGTALSSAQQNAQGAVELSNGTKVPQNPSLPKLNLSNSQREQIRKAVLTERNEVEFRLAATKSAKDFTPAVGAKIPKGVKAQSFPTPVLSQMPELRDYMYVKMKNQVLIVNGMTNNIVDIFSETQPLS